MTSSDDARWIVENASRGVSHGPCQTLSAVFSTVNVLSIYSEVGIGKVTFVRQDGEQYYHALEQSASVFREKCHSDQSRHLGDLELRLFLKGLECFELNAGDFVVEASVHTCYPAPVKAQVAKSATNCASAEYADLRRSYSQTFAINGGERREVHERSEYWLEISRCQEQPLAAVPIPSSEKVSATTFFKIKLPRTIIEQHYTRFSIEFVDFFR